MEFASAVSEALMLEHAVAEVLEATQADLDAAGSGPVDLALFFFTPNHHAGIRTALARIRAELPDAILLGCSAASVIGGLEELEDGAGVSLFTARMPDVRIEPFHVTPKELQATTSAEAPWRPRIAATSEQTRGFVLLGDPFNGDTEALIAGLSRGFPGTPLIGGLASGANAPGGNLLVLGEQTFTEGALGIAVSGPVELDTVVAQGCRPIGQPMFVTRCRENILLEVDGRPPLEILGELYEAGDARERALFQSSLFIGLQMHADKMEVTRGDFLVRNLVGSDPEAGVLAVGALLEETQVVQFHLRDGLTAAEDLDDRLGAYAAKGSAPPDARGALLFSCLGRGRQIYGVANHDTDLFRRRIGPVPIAGFFGNGEIGPVEGQAFLHAYTSAFCIFRPTPSQATPS